MGNGEEEVPITDLTPQLKEIETLRKEGHSLDLHRAERILVENIRSGRGKTEDGIAEMCIGTYGLSWYNNKEFVQNLRELKEELSQHEYEKVLVLSRSIAGGAESPVKTHLTAGTIARPFLRFHIENRRIELVTLKYASCFTGHWKPFISMITFGVYTGYSLLDLNKKLGEAKEGGVNQLEESIKELPKLEIKVGDKEVEDYFINQGKSSEYEEMVKALRSENKDF